MDLRIEGAEQLDRLSRELRAVGNKDLRRDLYRGIQRATKPLKERAKDAARSKLPKRGGLNEFVAASKFATKTRGSGANVGVRITAAKAGHDVRSIDRGRLRHPVFGNRSVWVNQSVEPGWFSETIDDGAPVVRGELIEVIRDVARRLSRG